MVRLMLARKRTFARLKKSSYRGEFLRLERVAEGGHVYAAVHDADHNVTLGKCIPYVGEIGTATNFKRSSIRKHRPRKPNIAIASIAHDGLCVGPYSLPSTVSVSERPSCGLTSFIQRAKVGGDPAYGTVDTQKHSLGLSY